MLTTHAALAQAAQARFEAEVRSTNDDCEYLVQATDLATDTALPDLIVQWDPEAGAVIAPEGLSRELTRWLESDSHINALCARLYKQRWL
jgi:hypothetical protein